MMKKQSAGILLYKFKKGVVQVLLVHPGGPFWKNKDEFSWGIPKGEFGENESALDTAIREFNEETDYILDDADLIELNPIEQNSGKIVYAWATEKDIDVKKIKSNLFDLEWPPKSGKIQQFPEVDKGEWFYIPTAKRKILKKQFGLIEDLISKLRLSEKQIQYPIGYIDPEKSQLNLFE